MFEEGPAEAASVKTTAGNSDEQQQAPATGASEQQELNQDSSQGEQGEIPVKQNDVDSSERETGQIAT